MKTETLLDLYCANLASHRSEYKDLFACPLCLRLFSRDQIERLSIEHIIPEQLGGKLLTLTCKDCNNTHGRDLDAKLIDRCRFEDRLAGKNTRPFRASVKVANGSYNADVVFAPDEIEIRELPQYSNPILHKQATDAFNEGARTLNVSHKLNFTDMEVNVAILRSAYLMIFRHFGYGYILHHNLNPIRAQLLSPKTQLWRTGILYETIPAASNQVGVVWSPKHMCCFVVRLDLSTAITRRVMVMLPGLGTESDLEVCERWTQINDLGASDLTLQVSTQDYDECLVRDPYLNDVARLLWREVVNDRG